MGERSREFVGRCSATLEHSIREVVRRHVIESNVRLDVHFLQILCVIESVVFNIYSLVLVRNGVMELRNGQFAVQS